MAHHYAHILVALLLPAAALAQPPMDEVACYAFGGNALDGSGNGHHGTVMGALLTADRFGTAGMAYTFDGSTTYIEVPDFSAFGISGEVSVGMWVRAESFVGNFVVSLWPDEFTDRFAVAPYYGHTGGSTIFWDFGDCTAGGRSSIIPYPFVSQWEHFTFTSSAINNRMRIYLNGDLIHEEFHHSVLINTNRALELGGGNVPGYSHWDGDLDEIVLYARELSSSEAADLYTYGAPCQYMVGVAEQGAAVPTLLVDAAAQAVVMSSTGKMQFQVFDATGRSIVRQQLGAVAQQWNYAGLPSGIYIVQLEGDRGTITQKLILE